MRKVIISKRASNKLAKLLEYLEKEWSLKVKNDFIEKLDKAVTQIRKYPKSAEESKAKSGLRKYVVTNQTTVFYRFDSKSVKIVTLFDNRMDPEKLKNEL
ncbi:MAG: type II toxin-antitoxin system RelE/ParE family toxin [Bacteroidales bacterium]|nr:type II toxin-antitoxin system RelE/ParE family toxin [Bacteroidales bacterium]MCF8377864.1 type II toxin-antitoxin system RelE/ParE family toxin [Bacteroidales bacterium]